MEDAPLVPLIKKKLSDFAEESLSSYMHLLLKEGKTKLPSEVELAQTLSVSRTTIRRALSELEHRGAILRIHGRGTFINPSISQVRLGITPGRSVLRLIQESGFEPAVKVLYFYECEAPPLQQSALSLKPGERIMTVCKICYADGVPVMLLVDDIPPKYLGEQVSEEELSLSAFETIRRGSGILCVRDEVEISTACGNSILAYSMGKDILSCDSVLVLNTINYSGNGEPIFIRKEFFNTDYIKFSMVRPLDVYE